MWHSISHFAQTTGHAFALLLSFSLAPFIVRMVETKRALPAIALFALFTIDWFAMHGIKPFSLECYLFLALIYIGIAAWQYRRKTVNKPLA